MAEKDFIKENIVGRKEDWRKRAKHYARVALSALLFGTVSAGVFVGVTPRLKERLYPTEAETAILETGMLPEDTAASDSSAAADASSAAPPEGGAAAEGTAEASGGDTAETEASPAPAETTSAAELVQRELANYSYTIEDYEKLNAALKHVASDAEPSLVEVNSQATSTDLFGMQVASGARAAGMIVARNGDELLILTASSIIKEGNAITVTVSGNAVYNAQLKALDQTDGLAVVAISQQDLSAKDRHELRVITIGNAGRLQRGDLLVAVGAPDGVYPSYAVGSISSISYNATYIDGCIVSMQANLDAASSGGSFVLNTKGELIGWVSSHLGDTESGYRRIAVATDFLAQIQTMSNGSYFPYIGLRAQEVTAEMTHAGLPSGLYIQECEKNSPAYNAGIQSGDIVTRINDTEIRSMPDYRKLLGELQVGDVLRVTVQRQSQDKYTEIEYQVKAEAR